MNIFEELIEELKEENLLEETVIETNSAESKNTYNQPLAKKFSTISAGIETIHKQEKSVINPELTFQAVEFPQIEPDKGNLESANQNYFESNLETTLTDSIEEPKVALAFQTPPNNSQSAESNLIDDHLVQNLFQQNDLLMQTIIQEEEDLSASSEPLAVSQTVSEDEDFDFVINPDNPLLSKTIPDDHEFFRRRATEEVNSLQIVEHIISAIEREQMKAMPKPYDDLSVSLALHDFLKVTENPNSLEHTQAEFKLMQETESWYSALSQRDNIISVADLRKYCENARPALSSQALISLTRFYRNSPFSEVVRGKFEMVLTRLLTKEKFDDTREMIFDREELVTQISNLYADWSSIPLYETNEDDSDVLIGVLKFEDFASEITNATTFDELIKNDFFNRLKIYKESTGEKFFAPLLTATAIESNVVVGNKYVELIQLERQKDNGKLLQEKYNFLLDQSVSDVTSKTLQLIEVLKEKKEVLKVEKKDLVPEIHEVVANEHIRSVEKPIKEKKSGYKVNKLLVAIIVLAFLFLGGMYAWSESYVTEIKTSSSVVKVDLESYAFKEYFKTARISKNTFFAITETDWDKLSEDVKKDVLKKTFAAGIDKGYDKVHVLNSEGKTVAFASDEGITLDPR